MMLSKRIATFALLFVVSVVGALSVVAQAAQPQIKVDDPWVRATVPGQSAGGLFMILYTDTPVELVSGSTEIAAAIEIHTMKIEGDVMRMQQVKSLPVTPQHPVALAPGGYHIMLMGLKRQIKAGDQVPVQLVFQTATGEKTVVDFVAPARALGAKETRNPAHAH